MKPATYGKRIANERSGAVLALFCAASIGVAADWAIDRPRDGVLVLRNDTGAWGGFSMGVAHQNQPRYQVRKTIDLTALPPEARSRAKSARLRFYFAIQDYSWARGGTHNGLNEAFEIVVNGQSMRFETRDPRFPARGSKAEPLRADWVDVALPLDCLDTDILTVVIRKLPGGSDDYIYPGIDNSVETSHSAVTFDGGETWHTQRLNTIDATGEYMIRLVLAEIETQTAATWTQPDTLDDPAGLVAWHGREGKTWRIELDAAAYDRFGDLRATVRHDGTTPAVRWLDGRDKELAAAIVSDSTDAVQTTLPPGQWDVASLTVTGAAESTVRAISIAFDRPLTKPAPVVDLCPTIAPPAGKRRDIAPSCRIVGNEAVLENRALRAVFALRPTFALRSLFAAEVDRNVLAHPEHTHLFRLKLDKRVVGGRDARVIDATTDGATLTTVLDIDGGKLRAVFRAGADETELRLGLDLTNRGDGPVTFHVAFPHLAGLELSEQPDDDHYLFPYGGGVIADVPTTLRTAYGENTCWWQMIDLFSPVRGGGVYLRCDDETGLYKCPTLRKGDSIRGEYSLDETGRGHIDSDMLWRNALEAAPGMGMAFDYLRRTRAPGTSFKPPDVCVGTHPGDWRHALRTYAQWARRSWPPRPYPSKLTHCWHVCAPGWGQKPLFKDGAYRTDYIRPRHDVAEMMSWWTWSDKGPWGVSMDRLVEELGERFCGRYRHYWVKEPATGKLRYPLNRGDYDGYMPEWGGLPALREHIERVRAAGILPMFYTDPILACANTKLGGTYGPTYGIMNPLWKDGYNTGKTPPGYVGSYGSFNMCLDTEWYSQWVAETMGRVCRETGIDGVRLDEYGHRGYVCHSPHHQHIFAEPGHNAWLQALARNVRQVHAAMDAVRPGLILTTEFPGHDCMAAALEGAIVYDVRRVGLVRPTPINLFRFFFPECKVFEIDRPHRPEAQAWMLWNAVGAFSAFYRKPQHLLLKENADAFTSRDAEPLIPTLVPRVYANRFRHGDKTIYTVLNAAGHTVDGPVLPLPADPARRSIDLLRGIELTPMQSKGTTALALRMKRDTTRVIAHLPRRLAVEGNAVRVAAPTDGLTLVGAATDGTRVITLEPGAPLPTITTEPRPFLLKLMRGTALVDAVPWP